MDEAHHPATEAATRRRDVAMPELDLDRLVWDPEYREAMRPWLKESR